MNRPRNILELLDTLAPSVQAAFLQSVQNVRSDTQLNAMVAALERGDIDGAMRFLNIDAGYFAPLDQALTAAYAAGGDWTTEGIRNIARSQGATVVARFDGRNPRAETFLRDRSSNLVVEIVEDQLEGIRNVLTANMEAGVNPRRAGLDLVGRLNRSTGRREGGLVGLTSQEIEYAENALAQLSSSDPADLRKYLQRNARNRRFDGIVNAAIRGGKPISAADASRITQAYRTRLLSNRGTRIARTELLGSLHAAADEAEQQLVDSGKIPADAVTVTWDSSEDSHTRDSHRAADGDVRGSDGTFSIGSSRMKHPGDTSLGAPASEVVQCRCVLRREYSFEFLLRDSG